jgi:hypothetical protein
LDCGQEHMESAMEVELTDELAAAVRTARLDH